MSKINGDHPELREGEVFLGNFRERDGSFEEIGRKTKRRGLVAYDINGEPVSGAFPVFVQRDEVVGAGLNPDTWE